MLPESGRTGQVSYQAGKSLRVEIVSFPLASEREWEHDLPEDGVDDRIEQRIQVAEPLEYAEHVLVRFTPFA